MAKRGKKYREMKKKIEDKLYPLEEAIKVVKDSSYSSFEGTIELHFAVNLPKEKEAKSVKGSLSLPHPVSIKESKIVVFCEKDDAEAAKKAGAVEAGLEDLMKKIQEGWTDFDVALATPGVMPQIAVLGKELGPKGLMPNPKTGTLVDDVKKGVEEFMKGKSKFACDDGGVVHVAVGKVDTDDEKIVENVKYVMQAIADVVGKQLDQLMKSVSLSITMGAGVRVDTSELV